MYVGIIYFAFENFEWKSIFKLCLNNLFLYWNCFVDFENGIECIWEQLVYWRRFKRARRIISVLINFGISLIYTNCVVI